MKTFGYRTVYQGVRHSSPLTIKTEIVGTRFERKSWLPVPVLMGTIEICQRPCLLIQIERIVPINALQMITKEVVEIARQQLVIGSV